MADGRCNIILITADDCANAPENTDRGAVRTDPNGTYRDLYLYCAQHTLGSHVGIYNYENFGNLYTTGPKDFFVRK